MVKGMLKFAETGVLVSAILGIYGFTFLTVFSLNPKVDQVVANDVKPQTSVLGTSVSLEQKVETLNISNDTFDLRTSLEKQSETKYIFTISYLNSTSVTNHNLMSLTNLGTESVLSKFTVTSDDFDSSNVQFRINGQIVGAQNDDKSYTFVSSLAGAEEVGVDIAASEGEVEWRTIKILIEL
jgi:hypothetical protein